MFFVQMWLYNDKDDLYIRLHSLHLNVLIASLLFHVLIVDVFPSYFKIELNGQCDR